MFGINKTVSKIKNGYIADLVVLDTDMNIVATVCRGEVIHS